MSDNTSLRLKRDYNLERSVISELISIFTTKWEETSQKTPREVMICVISLMKDSCLSYSSQEELSEENIQLQHSTDFFTAILDILKSNHPLPFTITGVDIAAILKNLTTIKRYAEGNDFSKDICDRINFFQTQLRQQGIEYENEASSKSRKSIYIGILTGIIAGFTFFSGEDSIRINSFRDFVDVTIIILLWVSIGYSATEVFYKIRQK